MHSDYLLFIDESGDHGLESIDPHYGVFVLCGALIRKDRYIADICPAFRQLKMDFWGHDEVIFHEHDLRKPEGEYAILQIREVREQFHAKLSQIMGALNYTLIYGVIKKEEYRARYPIPRSPYDLCMSFVLERAFLELNGINQAGATTHVVVECRGPKEDAQLKQVFSRIVAGQNACNRPLPFSLKMVPKASNSIGLQISDLVARPVGIKTLRPDQANRAYDVIRDKVRRDHYGRAEGWGVKVFP